MSSKHEGSCDLRLKIFEARKIYALFIVLALIALESPASAEARVVLGENGENDDVSGSESLQLEKIEPLPEMFGPSLAEEKRQREQLVEYDAVVAAALTDADAAYRLSVDAEETGSYVEPIKPVLPLVERQPTGDLVVEVSYLPNLLPSGEQGQHRNLGSCSGNCYQTDSVILTDHPNDVYASEYYVWLAIPQTNESNKCDGSSNSSSCFWFYAMNYHMDCVLCNSGIHIGPQRGDSFSGNAGNSWRMNIDGYNDGVHVGGQSTVNLPVATWMRVRTWRIASGNDGSWPSTPWSTFGVWALWGGVDHYLGSVTIEGTWIANSGMFMEVYEENDQCSTDLERGYFYHPLFRRNGGWSSFAAGVALYQDNCSNTTWIVQGQPDFIRDEREVLPRVIPDGGSIW